MRNIFLIARREYLERVRTRAFLAITIVIPLLMFGILMGPALLMSKTSGGNKHLVVVAPQQSTGEMIRLQLIDIVEGKKKETAQPQEFQRRGRMALSNLIVDVETDTSDANRAALTEKVKQKQLDGFLFATKEALAARKVLYVTRDITSLVGNEQIKESIDQALQHELLKSKGMTDSEVEAALLPIQLETQSPSGKTNPITVFFTILSMVTILYATVLFYGINVMRAIIEEKTSRIMEVMLSSAHAKEMMAGKILGVGAVGLTQVGVWMLVAVIMSAAGLTAAAGVLKGILSVQLLVYFGIFFLLGYVLYSTLCATVGSMVNSEQEAQQLQFLVMMPMILSVALLGYVLQSPESPVTVAASIFPFTSPLIMFLRVALESPPLWQVVLSIAVLIATVYGLTWLCSRIYRIGILMYGKKPTLPEIMKWLRYT